MPQLTNQQAKAAEKDAWDPDSDIGSSFEVLEDGDYLFVLNEVTVSDQPGPSGFHYWRWMFEHPESKSRIYENTSLSPQAAGKLGQMFVAFGVPATTPTENLLGEYVGVTVIKAAVTQGKNAEKGYYRNEAISFWPASEHDDFDPAIHGSTAQSQAAQASEFGADEPEPAPAKTARRSKRGTPMQDNPPSEEPF